MILHIFESGRHVAAPKLWAGWSAAAHAAVVAGVIGGAAYPPASPPEPEQQPRYILPRLPGGASSGAEERLRWVGLGAPPAPGGLAAPRPPGAPPRPRRTAPRTAGPAAEAPPPAWAAAADSADPRATLVYFEEQVDAVVQRDPTSEGPHYPDSLQAAGVEGGVAGEWVVDSAGRADSATFRALDATHPLFEAAVRAVLPRMRFEPARSGGRPVAQLVRQTFRFRIALPEPAPPPAAPPAPPR